MLVTGGASGIGRACALLFRDLGAEVWAADIDPVDETNALFAAKGIHARALDVRDEARVAELLQELTSGSGRLDIVIHSAGVGATGAITEISEEAWDRCLDTNLKGAFLVCKHALPLLQREGGSIVTIASNAGITPRAHDPVYCVSKAGLIMLTRALALAHARDRIRVNAICPGPVGDTRMMNRDIETADDPAAFRSRLIGASPLAAAYGRMSTPAEIAQAAAYLASEAAAMVTGTVLAIDGGKSIGVPPHDV